MTSGTMGLGPCPIPNETRMALSMLRPASCDARRLRRSAAWPARIGADADESAAAVCAASPAAQDASDRDERPHGSSAIAAHLLRCGMRVWMHGRAIGLQAGAPSVRCLRARRSTVPIPGPSVYALRYPSAGWRASCRCARALVASTAATRAGRAADDGRAPVRRPELDGMRPLRAYPAWHASHRGWGARREGGRRLPSAARATRTPSSYARLPCGCRGCRRTGRACWGSPGWIGIARLAATAADP